jgi:putative acetyltransferase
MNFKIRNEASKDFEQVNAILRAAFRTDPGSRLVDALLANGKAIISLVAAGDSDEVLGHILISPVSTPPLSDPTGIRLAPVAVRSDIQSQGIGSELIREGLPSAKNLDMTKELGYDYCVGKPRRLATPWI